MQNPLDRPPGLNPDAAELQELTAFAQRLADVAGPCILPHFRVPLVIENKGGADHYDPVTEADRSAEAAMREMITHQYPTHGIYGEEGGFEPGTSPMSWVIDPLDGTRAFITGALHWGTLIALFNGMRPIIGVMDQPYTRERFIGNRNGAWWRRDGSERRLRTRECAVLADAVLYTTSPALFADPRERAAFEQLAQRVRLTRYGGDCYSYCMLASGYVDLVVESDLQPYDVQALIPIIEAAGGLMTTWSGGVAHYGGSIIAAGNPTVHQAAMRMLQGQ
jgi:histidinol phosphatase-like enzyme (inositol monophosphatase family)